MGEPSSAGNRYWDISTQLFEGSDTLRSAKLAAQEFSAFADRIERQDPLTGDLAGAVAGLRELARNLCNVKSRGDILGILATAPRTIGYDGLLALQTLG